MRRFSTTVLAVQLCCLFAVEVSADNLGLEVGGGYWLPSTDGDVIAGVDVEDELDIEDFGTPYFYFNFEHPLPLVPNLRMARTHLDEEGQGRLATNFSFEGSNFTAGQTTLNNLDLSSTDVTLYYELWDTSGDFDIGLTARWFNGVVEVGGTVESADIVIPMLYVKAQADLPFTGFYLGGMANVTSYSGDSISDAEVKVGWRKKDFILPDFGVEVGYRRIDLDVDESVEIDVELSGAFINFNGKL